MKTKAPSKPVTKLLAQFVHDTTWSDLPRPVVDRTAVHILDTLGCTVFGSKLPWTKQVCGYAADTARPGKSTVVGGVPLIPEWAAFINGTAAHGFELDDYHPDALAHPGCVVVPTAIAIGEELNSQGQDMILACALGIEIVVRIGISVASSMVVTRGFHETCIEGVFGAAATTGKLLGLDVAQLISAMGIAGSHASGTREYSHSGGEAKRLHAGLGAMGGIRSAYLAKRGYSGPGRILEGGRGVLQAFADEYSLDPIVDGLGTKWRFLDCSIKPYANCGLIHAPIDALTFLMHNHALGADNIEEIDVGVDRLSIEHCGSLPIPPSDMTGAQFNLPYSLGMTVALGGNGAREYWQLQKSGFDHPGVVAAASKVRLRIDPEVDKAFPSVFMSKVRVRRKDGKKFEHVARARGSRDNPLDTMEVKKKFQSLMAETRWAHEINRVAAAIAALKQNSAVRDIMYPFAP